MSSAGRPRPLFSTATVVLLGVGLPVLGTMATGLLAPSGAFSTNVPLHSLVEAVGLFAGLVLAALLLLRQRRRGDPSEVVVAAGLLAMCVLDGFHSAVAPGNLFVWLHSVALLAGGLFFALVWLSGASTWSPAGAGIPAAALLGAAVVGAVSTGRPAILPAMISGGAFTPTAAVINILGGVLFTASAAGFLLRHRRQPRVEELLFATFCLLNGSAGLLFSYSHAWDPGWWLWHGLRMVGFLIIFGYSFVLFWRSGSELESRSAELSAANASLQELLRQVAGAIELIGATSRETVAGTAQLVASSSETAATASKTATTVEEVAQAATLAADRAKAVAESARRAEATSREGRQAVEEGVGSIMRIREQMETIAQSIVRLSERSQTIGGVIATVSDLADQSNLLAVNASIEAAKAGDQGKGFAVVAQEVKSLAEQSKQATVQVRGILTDILKATEAAVKAAEQGSETVDGGVAAAGRAGEAIGVLAGTIVESAQAAQQIAVSSRQQEEGTSQIALAVKDISRGAAQVRAGAQQQEQAAQNLNELGRKLKQLIETYKL